MCIMDWNVNLAERPVAIYLNPLDHFCLKFLDPSEIFYPLLKAITPRRFKWGFKIFS